MPPPSRPSPRSRPGTTRRQLLLATAAGLGLQRPAVASEPPALVFVGFELIDDHPDPARLPAHEARLAQIGRQMATGLDERNLYRVIDPTAQPAVQQALARARSDNEYLHRCNGCLAGIAAAAGAPLVGVGWVQRVSNLILNLNLAVWAIDPRGGQDRMTLTKSVDIRGDNDESWRRGIAFMLRDMVERRERQPRYGL